MIHLKNNIKFMIGVIFRYFCLHTNILQGKTFIFMYHRVRNDTDHIGLYDSAMFITDRSLDMHISELSTVFNIVSLDDIDAHINDAKPSCVLTFDDGWLDNYTCAYPVLRQRRAPAIIFVTVNYIGTNKSFWFHHIWNIANSCKTRNLDLVFFNYFGDFISTKSLTVNEDNISEIIHNLKELESDKIDRIIKDAYIQLGFDEYTDQTILNWDQVGELSRNDIAIGSHGLNHYILTTVSNDYKEQEIVSSIAVVREKVEHPSAYFCYPNGNSDPQTIEIVRQAGYKGAIGTDLGYNNTETEKFNLRRIALHEDIAYSPGMLWFRIFQAYINGSH